MPDISRLSINLATLRGRCTITEALDAVARNGVPAVSPWRDQIADTGLAEAARIVRANGLKLTGLCRGGFFPAPDAEGRARALDAATGEVVEVRLPLVDRVAQRVHGFTSARTRWAYHIACAVLSA